MEMRESIIDEDRRCARCDYSLRTLQVDGDCPECGYAVAESLGEKKEARVVALQPRHERWRRRMRWLMWMSLPITVVPHIVGPYVYARVVDPSDDIVMSFALTSAVGLTMFALSLTAWFGFRARCQYAQFLKVARGGTLSERTEADRRRDERIAKREGIYTRNIGGAKILLGLHIICPALFIAIAFVAVRRVLLFSPVVLSTIPWLILLLLLIWINAGRREHARSIQRYRELAQHRAA